MLLGFAAGGGTHTDSFANKANLYEARISLRQGIGSPNFWFAVAENTKLRTETFRASWQVPGPLLILKNYPDTQTIGRRLRMSANVYPTITCVALPAPGFPRL